MKIYVASSWRNHLQPAIVSVLRASGHEVYDFKNPPHGGHGFSWKQVDPECPVAVDVNKYRELLASPIAQAGYENDITALRECDAVVYVLPCGRSASWEFGYAMGQGKPGYVIWFGAEEPDLMFMEATIIGNMEHLWTIFGEPKDEDDCPV